MICEHLCLDLFDPAWEIRHGAGIGLRSILKAHGEGAGKKGTMHFLFEKYSNICTEQFIFFQWVIKP